MSKLKKVDFRKCPHILIQLKRLTHRAYLDQIHIKHAFWVNIRAQKLILTAFEKQPLFLAKKFSNIKLLLKIGLSVPARFKSR